MTLMLHVNAEPVDYDGLRSLPIPEATATHVPIPHFRLVDMLRHTLTFYGHAVIGEHYGVTQDGMRFFSLLSLKSPYTGYEDTVGLRNSHDKTIPIGIGFGSRVFVCDNMAFIADHVIKRKHTANAKRDLPGLVGELVEPLAEQRERQHKSFERYKRTLLTDQAADHAIMQMYRDGVVNLQRIPAVLEQWDRPTFEGLDGRSAWRLFNAATYALNGRVMEHAHATPRLHQIIDGACETVQ